MTALTKKRGVKPFKFSSLTMAAAVSTSYWQGGVVGFDTAAANGLVKKPAALTGFWAVGLVAEDKVIGAGGGSIDVNLFREVWGYWFANDGTDTVVANDVGGLCYWLDDQTVKRDDDTNTLSVAGRIWAVHATKGVLVEPVQINVGDLSGIDS